jgi:hypothetical protein
MFGMLLIIFWGRFVARSMLNCFVWKNVRENSGTAGSGELKTEFSLKLKKVVFVVFKVYLPSHFNSLLGK